MRPDHSGSMSICSPFLILLAAIMISLPGCGGEESTPTVPEGLDISSVAGPDLAAAPGRDTRGGHNEYPLDAGNWWSYEGSLVFVVGTGSPQTHHFTRDHSIWGTEELFGREYIVERRTVVEMTGTPVDYWIRNRQDKTGLYEADYSITIPPAGWDPGGSADLAVAGRRELLEKTCRPGLFGIEEDRIEAFLEARERLLKKIEIVESLRGIGHRAMPSGRKAGGVLEDEITRLGYPLRPGQEWVIRPDPFFGASVTGREKLETPAGIISCWRITITSALFGEGDLVYQWFGKEGLIGMFAHLESEMTDPSGNPLDLMISEEGYLLTGHGSSEGDCEEEGAGAGEGSFLKKGETGSE